MYSSNGSNTSNKWPSATKDEPCPQCGKPNRCRIAPDGGAGICWRNGSGETWHTRRANGSGHAASAKCEPKHSQTFPSAEAAINDILSRMRGGQLAATWSYPGDVMRVARFDLPDGSKTCRPVHRAGSSWRIGDPPGSLPLYRGDELPADGPVWIVEGEKCADIARSIGLAAVTSAHGSSGAAKSDWSPLAGRDCIILPDHDASGEKYAAAVSAILSALTPAAASVKIIRLPGLGDGEDIEQYLAAGGTREDIEALAAETPVSEPVAEGGEPWPEPKALPAGLPPVEPFDYTLLPTSLHDWIEDIAERMQCPPDYIAATALIVASSLIGRKIAIRPKRHDDWSCVCNLYGIMVGRPSLLKSPPMKEVLKFLDRLEIQAKQEYEKQAKEYLAASLMGKATKAVQKKELEKAVKDGGDAQSIARAMAEESNDAPVRRRYKTNDCTVEKLGVLLAENPNGILVYQDEIISLLRSMEREGHEADRGFYLTAWAGDSRYTYDRIGRGTLDIEAAIVSIVGSIQPGVLQDYLRGAVCGGSGDDGLMQRFQASVFPDLPATWKNVDRYPDRAAKQKSHDALQRLVDFTPQSVDADYDKLDRHALPFLRFDPIAQPRFDAWRAELETRLRAGKDHPAIEAHLGKYRSLIPSIALILHLLEGAVGAVGIGALERAIHWGRYLESHARRLYAGVTEAPAVAARLLAAKIEAGEVSGLFTARDIYRMGWAGLDRDRTEAAIDVLLSLHWIEERSEPTQGRTKTRYAINPKISTPLRDGTDKTDKSPSVGFVSTVPEGDTDFSGIELDTDAVDTPEVGNRAATAPPRKPNHHGPDGPVTADDYQAVDDLFGEGGAR